MAKSVLKATLLLAIMLSGTTEVIMASEKKADVRGTITSVTSTEGKGMLGNIRVEGKLEEDTNVDAASIRVTDKTKLEKMQNGKKASAVFSDFKKGTKVEAGFSGPVAESYPVQANAAWILLLSPN